MSAEDLAPAIVTGMPPNLKDRPRSDFIPSEFDRAIITKGYRLWWSRAALCPCRNNDQTEQADPLCPLCHGTSFYHFAPDDVAVRSGKDLYGNPVEINEAGDAIAIRAIMTNMTKDVQALERFGEWISGMSRVTVQHGNRLGYRDKLTSVDSVMPWSQIVKASGESTIEVVGGHSVKGFRYPMVSINHLRSLDRVFRAVDDYELQADGTIRWVSAPPSEGERLSVHGLIHPVWIVMDHLHVYRDTEVSDGASSTGQSHAKLPVQASVKLEFLVE